jgi:hypothetical protein
MHNASCTHATDLRATLLLSAQLVDKVCKIELIPTFQATPMPPHCKPGSGHLAQVSLPPSGGQHGQVAGIQSVGYPITVGILVLGALHQTGPKMACFGPFELTPNQLPPQEAQQTRAHTQADTSSRWFSLPHAMPSATLPMCTSPH